MEKKIKLLAVCGPTASGKTALGVALARAYSGEVISCDSMQIYRGMEIGTAKPTKEEMGEIPHHLLDFCDPETTFSVVDYTTRAAECIEDITARGTRPILVGGTGLYARSLLRSVPFTENSRSDEVRAALQKEFEEKGIGEIYARLQAFDPEGAAEIHPNNTKRVIRALEYCLVAGEPFSVQAKASREVESDYDYKMICLGFQNRDNLYARINLRVDQMIQNGLLDEAKQYYEQYGLRGKTSVQAIGYKELFPYFDGQCTLEEAVENIKKETRRYAKRQLTWFRREENTVWLYVDAYDSAESLIRAAEEIAADHFEK
ncbi:MAG: tRNA (adenosine(37)-N6)-dimethylallyltransferase MiaA [Clostridia bacterium]|nr:tRNA (adenosine(37)-N6)-dimethylallyltransferase MiaA [Clostridia bacterium]